MLGLDGKEYKVGGLKMVGNPVKFVYVSSGSVRPTPVDPDAIYFLEGEKRIFVGNTLIADHAEPIDIASYLAPYLVKDIQVTGEGSVLSNVALDSSTGKLIFEKSDISIEKGTTPEAEYVPLSPGSEFRAMSSTSVNGSTITDNVIRFKLPVQITSVDLRRYDSGSSRIVLDITSSDNSVISKNIDIFGSAAFEETSSFATAEQGLKADAAMPAVGGIATDASITLANDPSSNMEAATKQYVDSSISNLGTVFHYRGESSTIITDGGREEPTIDGESIDPTQGMSRGDVVTYNGKEFLWVETHWQAFGDEGSYALRTIRVDGSDGLSGGGTLDSNVTISHSITGTGSNEDYSVSSNGVNVISGIIADKFGHVQSVSSKDITNDIADAVEEAIEDVIPDYSISEIEDISGQYSKIYVLTKDGVATGASINIPNAKIIQHSEIKVVEETDVPYEGAEVGDKYVDFTTGDGPDDHIYIPVSDISAIYDGGQGIDITGTTVSHESIGDGSDISTSLIAQSGNDDGVLIVKLINLERDSMGHLTGNGDTEEEFELLTRETIEELVDDSASTWTVTN